MNALSIYNIKRIWSGIKRWFSYVKVAVSICDYDYTSILEVEKYQIIRVRDRIAKYDNYDDCNHNIEWINKALACLNIVLEDGCIQLIDNELDKYVEENRNKFDSNIKVLHMWDADSGMIDNWHKYCQRQMRDSYHMLDEKLIFSNDDVSKKDYSSKKLNYPLEACPIPNYEKLMSILYSDEERAKIEWAICSIITGDSKKIQKFMVLYGAP